VRVARKNATHTHTHTHTHTTQPGSKGALASFSLRGPRGKKKATYRKREGRSADEQYTLARFDPVLLNVAEEALAGRLSQDEYPSVR
jgi:hypothetical protein